MGERARTAEQGSDKRRPVGSRRQADPPPARPRPGVRSARRGTRVIPPQTDLRSRRRIMFLDWLRNRSRGAGRRAGARLRPYRRPTLEALEDRWLPSTLTVLNNLDSGPG